MNKSTFPSEVIKVLRNVGITTEEIEAIYEWLSRKDVPINVENAKIRLQEYLAKEVR